MRNTKSILLIEDDPIFSKIFFRDPKNKGLERTTYRDVEEIAELLDYDFKAIVIDNAMARKPCGTSTGSRLSRARRFPI